MFKEYTKRVAVCLFGLVICSMGNFFSIKAGDVGTNSWNTLALGIASFSGISFGSGTLVISLLVVIIDLFGKGKLGFGTILNATLVAAFSDFFLAFFSFVPEIQNPVLGIISTLFGQALISLGSVFYMSPALGCGPRDTLMVIIGQQLPKFPIGSIRFGIEFVVLIIGMLMGAPFGIGTVAVMLLQASIFQFVCTLCRFDPRSIKHEDVIDTCRRIFSKVTA